MHLTVRHISLITLCEYGIIYGNNGSNLSLTEEMVAQSIAYHAHRTVDGDKYCWLVCIDIKSAMLCSLRLAPTMINHLTS